MELPESIRSLNKSIASFLPSFLIAFFCFVVSFWSLLRMLVNFFLTACFAPIVDLFREDTSCLAQVLPAMQMIDSSNQYLCGCQSDVPALPNIPATLSFLRMISFAVPHDTPVHATWVLRSIPAHATVPWQYRLAAWCRNLLSDWIDEYGKR